MALWYTDPRNIGEENMTQYKYTKEFKSLIESIEEFNKIKEKANLPESIKEEHIKTITKQAYIISIREAGINLYNALEAWMLEGAHIEKPEEFET